MESKRIFTSYRVLLVVVAVVIAACGGGGEPEQVAVPTVAELPTQPTATESPTATETIPATLTETPSPTPTATTTGTSEPTVTPSVTITDTVTPTPTSSATPTETPFPTEIPRAASDLIDIAVQTTILPPATADWPRTGGNPGTAVAGAATPTPATCFTLPTGGFGTVYSADAFIASDLGCPIGNPPLALTMESAYQSFERGAMVWLEGPPGYIYALNNDGTFGRYNDTFNPAVDPERGSEAPPPNLIEPVRGFGKVWRENPVVRTALGWAVSAESGGTATVQNFDRGMMVYLPQRGDILVMVNDPGGLSGRWRAVAGQY